MFSRLNGVFDGGAAGFVMGMCCIALPAITLGLSFASPKGGGPGGDFLRQMFNNVGAAQYLFGASLLTGILSFMLGCVEKNRALLCSILQIALTADACLSLAMFVSSIACSFDMKDFPLAAAMINAILGLAYAFMFKKGMILKNAKFLWLATQAYHLKRKAEGSGETLPIVSKQKSKEKTSKSITEDEDSVQSP